MALRSKGISNQRNCRGNKVNVGVFTEIFPKISANMQSESPFELLEKASQNEKHRQRYNSNPSHFELLSHFTNGRTEFPYELALKAEIPAPVYRERNFKYYYFQ